MRSVDSSGSAGKKKVEVDCPGTVKEGTALMERSTRTVSSTHLRFLKAGYYKVALSWTNNSYTPVSNNAAAFNVTLSLIHI